MAVQMATSSAQDFLNFGLGTETNASSGKTSGAHSFKEALASVATTERGKHAVAHSTNTSGNGASSQKSSKSLASTNVTLAMNGLDGETVPEMEEIASLLRQTAHVSDRLKALTAHLQQTHPDVDIDELLAQANFFGVKPGRFDPDAILAEFAPELVCDEPALDVEEDENSEMSLSDLLLPNLPSETLPEVVVENDDALSADEATLAETDVEILPGDVTGEDALLQLAASEAIVQNDEVPSVEGDAESVKIDQTVTQTGQMPELSSETLTEVDDALSPERISTDETTAIAGDVGESAQKTPDAATTDDKSADATVGRTATGQSLEELLAQYREEQQSRSDGESDTSSRFSRQSAQKDRKASANASSTRRQQSAEQTNTNQTRDTRADASRDIPFSSLTGTNFKDVLETPSAAQNASFARTGVAYTLNREFAFSDGINTVLEFMRTDGTSEARIVVEPPALGHIDVSLRASSAGMEATFRVDNEHLKQMLQQQLDILKSSLQMQGIHVSSLAVDIRNKDDQRGRETAYATGKKSRHTGGVDGLDEGLDEGSNLVRLDLEKGLLHWVG